jgi:hypothetical protein
MVKSKNLYLIHLRIPKLKTKEKKLQSINKTINLLLFYNVITLEISYGKYVFQTIFINKYFHNIQSHLKFL